MFYPLPNAKASDASGAQSLVLKSTAMFKSSMADSNMIWFHNNAQRTHAIFIVPQMIRDGFIVGDSSGSGVLPDYDTKTATWSYPASISIGLQIGADAAEISLMVMTKKGLNVMLSTEFKLGADIAVAADPVGASAKAQTAEALASGRSQGAFGSVSIEGAIIAPRDKWNSTYCGRLAGSVDIFIQRSVSPPSRSTAQCYARSKTYPS